MNGTRTRQRRHLALLLSVVLAMFGFAFALVPLYEVFCDLTGLNGKASGLLNSSSQTVQDAKLVTQPGQVVGREVTIQFLAHVGNGLPWEFRPMQRQLRVRVGEMNSTRFYVRNRAGHAVIGQAVPSVSPGVAAQYLHKTECFCFRQQRLEAGDEVEMPLTFIVDRELPAEINTFSLSYTFFYAPETNESEVNEEPGGLAQAL